LALELARRQIARRADGVWLVDLASGQETPDVAAETARVLDVRSNFSSSGAPRRLAGPELLGKAVDGDGFGGMEEQEREQRALLPSAERDLTVPVDDLERAEKRKQHARSITPRPERVNPTGLIVPRGGGRARRRHAGSARRDPLRRRAAASARGRMG